MVKISGTTITMTRGDTLSTQVTIKNADGTDYDLQEGDVVRFALKKDYTDDEPLILKVLYNDDLVLLLEPNDTKQLEYGNYVYDIELTTEQGAVDTFISKARLTLTEEVY